jgi:hypothetical protein
MDSLWLELVMTIGRAGVAEIMAYAPALRSYA